MACDDSWINRTGSTRKIFSVPVSRINWGKMLRSRKAIPRQQRTFLAELAEGKIKPPMRGKKNTTLTYEQRAEIHSALQSSRWTWTVTREKAEWLGNELQMEVGEVRKHFDALRAALIAELARKHGVSEASIKKIPQRFKEVSPYSPAVLARIRKRQ